MRQCKLYSKVIKDIKPIPHPHRLPWKDNNFIELSKDEKRVYTEVQSIFNAKPDLAITTDDTFFVYEIKFAQNFDDKQLKRTERIGEIWAELLYKDLGFRSKPEVIYFALGLEKYKSNKANWE